MSKTVAIPTKMSNKRKKTRKKPSKISKNREITAKNC